MPRICSHWNAFITSNWDRLAAGQKVNVPAGLVHPRAGGFEALDFAEPVGQARDWAYSWSDGSRLHIHEHADGRMVAHRDRYDPKQGIVSAVMHIATETTTGLVVGGLLIVGTAIGGAVYAVNKLSKA